MKEYTCLKKQLYSIDEFSMRPIQASDIESIRLWRNSQMEILRQKKELTSEDQVRYFNNVVWPSMQLPEPDQILFGFTKNGKLIGYGGLVHISWIDFRAEVSFLLDNELVGDSSLYREYFLIYLDLIRMIAFEGLDFNRLYTETYDIRDAHISILLESGFKLEGRMKEHVFIKGKFVDSLIHGYLKKYGN
jgi:hypothetical protein